MSLSTQYATSEKLPNGSYVDPTSGSTFMTSAARSRGVKRDLSKATRRVSDVDAEGLTHEAFTTVNITFNMSTDTTLEGADRSSGANADALWKTLCEQIEYLTGFRLSESLCSAGVINLAAALTRIEAGLFAVPETHSPVVIGPIV